MSQDFTTQELALAAFLKSQGHAPALDPPDARGFVTFRVPDPDGEVSRLASAFFQRNAETPALAYYYALNDLRGAIRSVRSRNVRVGGAR